MTSSLRALSFLYLLVPAQGDVPSSGPAVGKPSLLLQETFELAAPVPALRAFRRQGDVGVVEGVAFSGRRSLRIEAAGNGPRRITLRGEVLKQLGGRHWGRLFFKVHQPVPPARNGTYDHAFVDAWTMAEWTADPAARTCRLFMNRKEVKDVAFSQGNGVFGDPAIPGACESMSFGWNHCQNAGAGFVAWIDDLALSAETRGILPAKK